MEISNPVTLLRRCGDSVASCPDSTTDQDWALLLRRYGHRLELGARRALRAAGARQHPDLVADLVQEVCCRLWEKRGATLRRFHGVSEAQACCYLRRLAENTAFDVLRAAGAQKRAPRAAGVDFDEQVDEVADPAPTPEESALQREKRCLLLRRLRALCGGRNGDRNVWILRRALIDGWTAREINRTLGLRADSSLVESLLFRARRQLRSAGIEVSRR